MSGLVLPITAMTCNSCAGHVEKALFSAAVQAAGYGAMLKKTPLSGGGEGLLDKALGAGSTPKTGEHMKRHVAIIGSGGARVTLIERGSTGKH